MLLRKHVHFLYKFSSRKALVDIAQENLLQQTRKDVANGASMSQTLSPARASGFHANLDNPLQNKRRFSDLKRLKNLLGTHKGSASHVLLIL